MSNNNEETKQLAPTTVPTVDGFDGFTDETEGADTDGQGASGSVIQGFMLKYTNEATWELRDGEEVPSSRELIAVDVLRICQKWVDKQPVETRVLGPNEKVPDIEALNAAAPKTEWSTDFNGNPRGPWQFQYIVYLLDPEQMDKYSYPAGTVGSGIAVRDLVDKVKWMRRIRGDKVCAVVTLSNIFMNTRFGGRQRPHFIVKRWVQFGGENPALPSPAAATATVAEQPKAEPSPGIKTVTEPTLSEEMGGDKIPFDDSLDFNAPNTPAPKAPASPPRKPTARSQMTKRGVQKIAGGRGR